jgi:D-serine deaminase-like pyridoxal phosphate-dependent protein
VYLKIDTGYGRSGIRHDDAAAIDALLREIDNSPRLRFEGILTHGGDSYEASDADDIVRRFARSRDRLAACAARIRETHTNITVSVGDTPGCSLAEDFDGIDEIRPGNFVFYDAMQLRLGSCAAADIAVALACPVTSLHPDRCEAVVYGGSVHLSKEAMRDENGEVSYGKVVILTDDGWSPPLPDTRVRGLSQEHGIIRTTPEILALLHEGALIAVLPVHSCLTASCMRGYLMLDGENADHLAGIPYSAMPPQQENHDRIR